MILYTQSGIEFHLEEKDGEWNFTHGPIPYDVALISFFSYPGLILSSICDT